MDNYVGKKLDKTCPVCKQGWLHQYPQDKPGTHRCGRCGEVAIKTAAKPATTRKEA